ncbi:hypothetical protein CBS147343_4262 [Aspergillus niger]|nr:hypothetical protein CBS147343_4262 [Aspergillus niger]
MNAETRPVDLPSEFKKLHFTVRTDVMVQETKSLIKYFATPKALGGAIYDSSDVLQFASVLIWADAPTNAREEKGSCACHLIGGTYDAVVRAFGFFA